MSKSLRQFKSSLAAEKGDREALVTRIRSSNNTLYDDYHAKIPVAPYHLRNGLEYQVEEWANNYEIDELKKLATSGERRLSRLDEKFSKINTMYSKEVAEILFSSRGISKHEVLTRLAEMKQENLRNICTEFGNLESTIENLDRVYFHFCIRSYNFAINILLAPRYSIAHQRSHSIFLDLPTIAGLNTKLRFLFDYEKIEDEMRQIVDKIITKGGILSESK